MEHIHVSVKFQHVTRSTKEMNSAENVFRKALSARCGGHTPVIPALRTLRQKEREVKASLGIQVPSQHLSLHSRENQDPRFNQQQSRKNSLRLPANGRAT